MKRNTIELNAGPHAPIRRVEREVNKEQGAWVVRTSAGNRIVRESLADTPHLSIRAFREDAALALGELLNDLLGGEG